MHVSTPLWCKHAPKVSASHTNCVSEFPIILVLKLPLCVLVIFIDMDTYLTEGRNFKAFLKKNMQLLWAVVTYLL